MSQKWRNRCSLKNKYLPVSGTEFFTESGGLCAEKSAFLRPGGYPKMLDKIKPYGQEEKK
jgi:hypothetical protein